MQKNRTPPLLKMRRAAINPINGGKFNWNLKNYLTRRTCQSNQFQSFPENRKRQFFQRTLKARIYLTYNPEILFTSNQRICIKSGRIQRIAVLSNPKSRRIPRILEIPRLRAEFKDLWIKFLTFRPNKRRATKARTPRPLIPQKNRQLIRFIRAVSLALRKPSLKNLVFCRIQAIWWSCPDPKHQILI